MNITQFNEKLNRVDGNVYTIEEIINPIDGVYEAELIHDNVEKSTINIYTGSKLTGNKINTYTTSTPSLTPWKTVVKIFSTEPVLYITYEFTGDTVEAEDINKLQDSVNITQDELNNEIDRAKQKENEISNNLSAEIIRAKGAEKTLADNLATEVARATNAENTLTTNLDKEINRAKTKESLIDTELANRYTKDKVYTKEEVLAKIEELINNAPDVLDTFKEIADALGNDPNFATTMTTLLAQKVDRVVGKELSANDFTDTYKNNLIDTNNKKHEHSNKTIIDKITQTLLDNWNSAYSHISDAVKHITSGERTLWNTVSNKSDKDHIHDDRYYTESEINSKITTINNSIDGKANTAHTHTKSNITDFPTKVSQFTNDSGFITAKEIDTSQNHMHSNKSVLDKITQALLDTWNGKSEGNHTHNVLVSKGRKTASDLPSTWNTGLYMTEVYNNGYPCNYGNCLTLKSSNNAITQICMEWKGSDATIGSMWIRNRRDSGVNAWSDWREFSFTNHNHDGEYVKKKTTWNELEGI